MPPLYWEDGEPFQKAPMWGNLSTHPKFSSARFQSTATVSDSSSLGRRGFPWCFSSLVVCKGKLRRNSVLFTFPLPTLDQVNAL